MAVLGDRRSCRIADELANHVGEDAAVAVVGGFVGGVDARADGNVMSSARTVSRSGTSPEPSAESPRIS